MSAERVYVRTMPPALMTADQLLLTSIPDKRVELVRGVLVVREPAGYRHGRVAMNLAFLLSKHVEHTAAGQVVSGDTGFKLASDPDTVRAPDVAFISRERLPHPQTRGFPALGPDLVVEVLSPDSRPGETLAKIRDSLEGGPPRAPATPRDRRTRRGGTPRDPSGSARSAPRPCGAGCASRGGPPPPTAPRRVGARPPRHRASAPGSPRTCGVTSRRSTRTLRPHRHRASRRARGRDPRTAPGPRGRSAAAAADAPFARARGCWACRPQGGGSPPLPHDRGRGGARGTPRVAGSARRRS